jgi:hypothetical protein
MAWLVLEDRMYEGLKLMLRAYSNFEAFSETDRVRGSAYYLITNEDVISGSPGTASSTLIGTFNIDFYSNKRTIAYIRNNKSKLLEILADYNHYSTSSITYYFNGTILGIEDGIKDGIDDDPYAFRVKYEITHEKVS